MKMKNIRVIPNGFAIENNAPEIKAKKNLQIGFIGTLAYEPNVQGLTWFIDSVWPILRKVIPDLRLRLVGSKTEQFANPEEKIDGLGYVDDANNEISSWLMMIVPIHIGGGTRIKIAEGFARKCPVVSTRLGAYGYEVSDGEEILLADSSEEFANACLRLTIDSDLANSMVKKAHLLYQRNFSWDAQLPRLEEVLSLFGSN